MLIDDKKNEMLEGGDSGVRCTYNLLKIGKNSFECGNLRVKEDDLKEEKSGREEDI